MDLKDMPLFGALTRNMAWLNRRQRVLAQNVANADTPGYRARDLEKLDFSAELGRLSGHGVRLAKTDPRHLGSSAAAGGPAKIVKISTEDATPTGNTVNLPEEMMKMNETQVSYGLMTTLYNKNLGLLRIALGRGK
jgi:flagellar basal-body rod protein FlgB